MKLRKQLEELKNSDYYPFHMPGHKRKMIAENCSFGVGHDITEIDEFDNLHDASGILLEEQRIASKVFRTEETFFLVNGSSCGILSAIYTVCDIKNPKLLVARNCHKSVYHGVYLTGAEVDYLLPETFEKYSFSGAICSNDVETSLNKNSYDAVIITSPTYEGILSNVKEIVRIAHKYNIPVIVDEAHGAYLGILGDGEYFPKSAVLDGADLVIQSTHKTLPALTQTALLHVQGNLIDRNRLKQNLTIFQTSSPSYLLMESISDCIHYCYENKTNLSDTYRGLLTAFYEKSKSLKNIEVIDFSKLSILKDPGKILIFTKNVEVYSGKDLYNELRDTYHLQMEMAAYDYVLAMTSIMDEKQDLERLLDALGKIDQKINDYSNKDICDNNHANCYLKTKSKMTIKEAMNNESSEKILLEQSIGRVGKDFIYLYPPGIPVVAPGEIITEEIVCYLKRQILSGLEVKGLDRCDENYLIHCI